MHSRRHIGMLIALALLGALIVPLRAIPAAADETDFLIRVFPDRGPVGTPVTIFAARDPLPDGARRTVVWRCNNLGTDDRAISSTVSVQNGSWVLPATVPGNCVTQPDASGASQVWVTSYGNAPATYFLLGAAAASCPRVLFIGAHGVNEGNNTDWGPNVQAVWGVFHDRVRDAVPKAGNYPNVTLEFDLRKTTAEQLAEQLAGLKPNAEAAGAALNTQIFDQFAQCGTRTRIVLAGMSLGAWAVDLALHNLHGTIAGRMVLTAVAGAGVMGDPATPLRKDLCVGTGPHAVCRQGVATMLGRGYPDPKTYLDNGLPNRFTSLCLAYSDTYLDPVCGLYRVGNLAFAPNITAHEQGYQTTYAFYLANVLVGEVRR